MTTNYYQKYIKYKKKYLNLKESYYVTLPGIIDYSRNSKRIVLDNKKEMLYTIKKYDEIDKDQFTNDIEDTSRNYILAIDDVNAFDEITNKYGYINDDGELRINLFTLSENYKGIYVSDKTELRSQRFDKAFFKGKEYESWWEDDYDFDNVVMFD